MLQVTAENTALSTLSRYFNLVSKTGYVKHESLLRFLAYIFLIDFVEYTYDYFTQEDYDTVAEALGRLFSNGGCLMPYPVFCTNRAVRGRAHYLGAFTVRVTEGERLADRITRVTEDEKVRTV